MTLRSSAPARRLRSLLALAAATAVLLLAGAPALGLGTGTSGGTDEGSPVPIDTGSGTALACGLRHSLVLNLDGRILSFGDNTFGQLGDGTNVNRSRPAELEYPSDAVSIAAGYWHSLAATSDGSVYVWGRNLYGQLGTGETRNQSEPVLLEALPPVIAVAAGAHHSVALAADGAVYAWGRNTELEVGPAESETILDTDGTVLGTRVATPTLVVEKGAVAIAAGQYFTLVLMEDGTVLAFGANDAGQLGDGTRVSRAKPEPVVGLEDVVAISAGSDHALAVRRTVADDGTVSRTVWGWGSDAAGQLGLGLSPDASGYSLYPVRIDLTGNADPADDTVSLIAAGAGTSLVVSPFEDRTGDPRARLLVIGSNLEGALGLGSLKAVTRPTALEATSNGWTGSVFLPFAAIATSGSHTLLLGVKGQLGGMGRNDAGQLGDGTSIDRRHPVGSVLPDRIAPGFRTGSSLSVLERKADSLVFSWPAAADNLAVAGYEARYLDPAGEVKVVDFSDGRSGTVDGYDPTAPQIFRLYAYDADGNVSYPGLSYEFVPDGMTYEQAFPTGEEEYPYDLTPMATPESTDAPTGGAASPAPTGDVTPEPTESPDVTPEPTEPPDVTPGDGPVEPAVPVVPSWNPDDFGTPMPLEVPWDVDAFYGKGVVLPPFSLTPAAAAVAASLLLGLALPSSYLAIRRVDGMKGGGA